MNLNTIRERKFTTELTLDSWAFHMDHERGIVPVEGYPELYGYVCWECEEILLVGYEELVDVQLWREEYPSTLVEAISMIETRAVEHWRGGGL